MHTLLAVLSNRVKVELLPKSAYSSTDPVESQTLGISLERQRGVHAIDSDRRVDFDTWPGVLAYAPAGVSVFSESPEGGEYLAVRWLSDVDEVPRAMGQARVQVAGHRQGLELAMKIRRLLLSSHPDLAFVEDLVLRLIAMCPNGFRPQTQLDRRVFARVLEKIRDEYWRPITLSEMALEIDRSELTFLREFDRAIGMTPHAFLVETRLQAARRMLEHSAAAISTIALDCGFSHQSHFGRAFRAAFGTTPLRYRKLFK
jgi:AraC family transcriptional regulator